MNRLLATALVTLLFSSLNLGAATRRRRHVPATPARKTAKVVRPVRAVRPVAMTKAMTPAKRQPVVAAPFIRGGPWTQPTYADSTAGDFIDGEDLTIRRAAVEALGPYNGSVVVVDPQTGRILTMVNQKQALGAGFQPCSTIKVSVALAGLNEQVIGPSSKFRVPGMRMDLTYALAHSNNYYFATLGNKLGFEKFSYYAHLFGYGEKAGLNIPGEQAGAFPSAPPKNGGVGMLTSFGEEISQTPLQLAALMSAIANGGNLFYLQHPRSAAEAQSFTPFLKRKLDIGDLIPMVKPGMRAAVEFGTAHRAREDGPIAGKTGTCTSFDNQTHLGWFGSFNDVGSRKLVVVVLLTGGRPAIGPAAAGIAGDVYRRLEEQNYFAGKLPLTPASLVSSQICCR
jgi:cell division protein FtsI/penicillin-binding protein 2